MPLILYTPKKRIASLLLDTDDYWNSVVLLTHLNGTNGSTNIIDEKLHKINPNTATLSTDNLKFGTSSAKFLGNTSFVVNAHSDFVFTGDFTFEGWVNFSSISTNYNTYSPTNQYIFDVGENGFSLSWNVPDGWLLKNAGTKVFSATALPVINTWYHWVVQRSGTTISLFINGQLIASSANFTSTIGSASTAITFGNHGGGNSYGVNGYLDEIRITKYVARYSGNFEVPTKEFNLGYKDVDYDPYWEQTVLSIHGGANDKYRDIVEKVFSDFSANNYSVSAYNTTNQVLADSENPFSLPNIASINLANNGQGVNIDINACIITTGPFCIEAWIKPTINNGNLINTWFWGSGNNSGWYLDINSNNALVLYSSNGSWNTQPIIYTSTNKITLNSWQHIALVRDNSNNITTFINGVKDPTVVNYAASLNLSYGESYSQYLRVGYTIADGNYYQGIKGKISNLRINIGNPVYTANFSVPTTPLTALPETTLLLKGEYDNTAFNDNNTFIESANSLAITKGGNVSQGYFSPFVNKGGSAYFDGNGDYLSIANTPSLNLGTSDFTFECWINSTSIAAGQAIVFYHAASNQYSWLKLYRDGSTITASMSSTGSSWDILVNIGTIQINCWHHIAISRLGNTIYFYLDGRLTSQVNVTGKSLYYNGSAIAIGNTAQNLYYFTGYITNLRVVVGSSLYNTSNFNVPTEPLTKINGTALLLNFDSLGIVDETRNCNLETVGNVSVVSTSKFGKTSLYFDGSGDYLIPSTNNFNFGTGDFTIEAWIYLSNISGHHAIFGGSVAGEFLFHTTNDTLAVSLSNVSAVLVTSPALTSNNWYHVAVVRNYGLLGLYVNGQMLASIANTTNITYSGKTCIGADVGRNNGFAGYIDDLRITKGKARYITEKVTLKSSSFSDKKPDTFDPYWDKVAMYLPMDGTSVTDTRFGRTISGKTSLVSDQYKFNGKSLYLDGTQLTSLGSNADLLFGSGDFTIECWIYPTKASSTYGMGILSSYSYSGSTNKGWTLSINRSLAGSQWALAFAMTNSTGTGYTVKYTPGFNLPINTWYHIAAVRRGNTAYLLLNGRCVAVEKNFAATDNYVGTLTMGTSDNNNPLDTNNTFVGYIDEVRLTKGVARYSPIPMNVPTSTALTNDYENKADSEKYDLYLNTTNLLFPIDGNNGSNSFTHIKSPGTLTLYGNVAYSTSNFKFGTSSIYFDGNGDYISISYNTNLELKSEDFTFECWFNVPNTSGYKTIIAGNSDFHWGVYLFDGYMRTFASTNGTDWASFISGDTGSLNGKGTILVTANTWHHFAWTRSGDVWSMWLDGVLDKRITAAGTVITRNEVFNIGRWGNGGYWMNGYLDDIRLTKGKARYTSNFTPSDKPLPVFSYSH